MANDKKFCAECGREMFLTTDDVSHHVGEGSDGIDYILDGDHVPFSDEGADEGADALDGDCLMEETK